MNGRIWLALWPAAVDDERLERKESLKTMVSDPERPKKTCDALERNIFVISENYMLQKGNLGLNTGISRVAHT